MIHIIWVIDKQFRIKVLKDIDGMNRPYLKIPQIRSVRFKKKNEDDEYSTGTYKNIELKCIDFEIPLYLVDNLNMLNE